MSSIGDIAGDGGDRGEPVVTTEKEVTVGILLLWRASLSDLAQLSSIVACVCLWWLAPQLSSLPSSLAGGGPFVGVTWPSVLFGMYEDSDILRCPKS